MAENALFPAYVKLQYHSAHGPHEQIIPTREWSATPLVPGNGLGSYTNWLGFPCDGQEMVNELIGFMSAYNPASTVYDTATVYTLDTETSPAIPRASHAFGTVGTNATPGWAKATQQAWILRDTEWQIFKLYQLDCATNDEWDAVTNLTGLTPALNLTGALTSTAWAWASRNGERPATFMKVTKKLNDELRKRYGMA